MTDQKLVIKPRKGIVLTRPEGAAILEDLRKTYADAQRTAHKAVEDRWGVNITLEAC